MKNNKFIFLICCALIINSANHPMEQLSAHKLSQKDYHLNYNSCSKSYGTTSLCDIAGRQCAKNLLPLCATIDGFNLTEKYEKVSACLAPLPEELKPFVMQHLFYLCDAHGWKVDYKKNPTKKEEITTQNKFVISRNPQNQFTISPLQFWPTTVPLFSTRHTIIETQFSPQENYLAIACINGKIQLYKNNNNTWSKVEKLTYKRSEKKFYTCLKFLNEETCIVANNKYLTLFEIGMPTVVIEQEFNEAIKALHIFSENAFIVITDKEYLFCKKNNTTLVATLIYTINTLNVQLLANNDTHSLAILDQTNKIISIFILKNEYEWKLVKTILCKNISNDLLEPSKFYVNLKISALEDPIICIEQLKTSKKFPGQGISKYKEHYFSLSLNYPIGVFKKKWEKFHHLQNELFPSMPLILSSIALAHSRTDKNALKQLKESPVLLEIEDHYREQLIKKITKLLEKTNGSKS